MLMEDNYEYKRKCTETNLHKYIHTLVHTLTRYLSKGIIFRLCVKQTC